MRRHQSVTDSAVRRPRSERLRRRQRWYFALMGVCIVLIVLAWNVVRLWSTTAAVVMSVVAAVIPPIAVIIANWGDDR
jgi:amino acid permease